MVNCRVFNKKGRSATTERRDIVIGDPVSQNYNYGHSIPPWMNSYADMTTVRVANYVHPARDEYYTKPGFEALQTFGSTTWVHASDDSSVHSSSTDNSVPIEETREQPERRGLRKRLFRNRGRNADGTLRDEYEDYCITDWGIEDEWAPKRRHRFF